MKRLIAWMVGAERERAYLRRLAQAHTGVEYERALMSYRVWLGLPPTRPQRTANGGSPGCSTSPSN